MKAEDTKKSLDKRMTLKEAISKYVFDGCSIAFSGMGGGQVVAPTYEIVRQGQKNLTLMGDSPCEVGDYLVGTGQIKRIEVAWLAFAVAGVSPSYRRAVEEGLPHKIEVREFSNYTMGLRFLAGAMGLPFMVTKSLAGTSVEKYNDMIKVIDDPYGGAKVALVPAAQYVVDAVVEVPFCSHPWNMPFAYAYDIPFHMKMMAEIDTADGFKKWMDEWAFGCQDHDEYCEKVGRARLKKLAQIERKFCKSIL